MIRKHTLDKKVTSLINKESLTQEEMNEILQYNITIEQLITCLRKIKQDEFLGVKRPLDCNEPFNDRNLLRLGEILKLNN